MFLSVYNQKYIASYTCPHLIKEDKFIIKIDSLCINIYPFSGSYTINETPSSLGYLEFNKRNVNNKNNGNNALRNRQQNLLADEAAQVQHSSAIYDILCCYMGRVTYNNNNGARIHA